MLSAIAYRGVPLQTAYSTTKYGLRGFTEALRAELVHDLLAVQVTMVHPPSVNTPFYSHAGSVMQKTPRPPPPVYQPEMLGEAIFLAGMVKRREWFVGEQSAGIKILNQVAPGLLDVASGVAGWACSRPHARPFASSATPTRLYRLRARLGRTVRLTASRCRAACNGS